MRVMEYEQIEKTLRMSTVLMLVVTLAFGVRANAATNVVLFVADDLGWGDVGYHGSEIRTPNIDRLAAEGMRLDRFYVHPLCSPTRGALMTGRSPLRTGVLMPFEHWYSVGPPAAETFLPQYLKEAGYQTFAVGKWHLGPNQRRHYPTSRGFDHFYGHLGGFIDYYQHTVWRGLDWQRNGETVTESGYATHLVTDEAVRLIRARDPEQPVFLYVAYNAPHSPMQAPDDAIAQYAHIEDPVRRVYAAMVGEMDRGIGRVISALDSEGILDDTLVLFMSDNGGKIRLGADNGQLRGEKGDVLEGGIRVPALLRWPARIKSGSVHDDMVSVEDLLPTLLAAVGVSAEHELELDGVDVWPSLTSDVTAPPRVRILTRHNRKDYLAAIFENEWKLVHMPDAETGGMSNRLFRIGDDPFERRDVATDFPEVVQRLTRYFAAIERGPVIGIGEAPIPKYTEPGGPSALEPEPLPPDRPPYADVAEYDD
jgi:arylsulfatase A-like enzyme